MLQLSAYLWWHWWCSSLYFKQHTHINRMMLQGKGRSETPAGGAMCLHNRWWSSSHMHCTYWIWTTEQVISCGIKSLNIKLDIKRICQRGRNCRWTSWSVFLGSNVTFFFFSFFFLQLGCVSFCLLSWSYTEKCVNILWQELWRTDFTFQMDHKYKNSGGFFFSFFFISQRSWKKPSFSKLPCWDENRISFISSTESSQHV